METSAVNNQLTPDDIAELNAQANPQSSATPASQPQPGSNRLTPDDIADLNAQANFTPEEIEELNNPQTQYQTTGQKVLTGLEGVAQGVAGPLATGAELGLSKLGVPGLSSADITAREEANPILHGSAEAAGLAGSLYTGVGEAALAAKGAGALADIANLGKVGSSVLKGMIANGLIQGGDEVSNWMLGKNNANDAVGAAAGRLGIAGLLGGGFGLLGGAAGNIGNAINKTTEGKLAAKGASWLAGFAQKGGGEELPTTAFETSEHWDPKAFMAGKAANDELQKNIVDLAAQTPGAVGATIGGTTLGPWAALPGFAIGKMFSPLASQLIGKPAASISNKTLVPIANWLSEGGAGDALWPAIEHYNNVANGAKAITNSVNNLFMTATPAITKEVNDKQIKSLDDYLKAGGLNQDIKQQQHQDTKVPGFAEGGMVKMPEDKEDPLFEKSALAKLHPEQNTMMNIAKGRVVNYLNSLRPQEHEPRLAFDDPPDQTEKKKNYHRAMKIALNPLNIFDEVKKGTIDPEHVQHFQTMYPETAQLIQKKLTERISQAQLKDEMPPYHVRTGMSLLLGTPLDSTLMPHVIQAAQAVFAPVPQPLQQGASTKNKKNTSTLTKAPNQYMTAEQARLTNSNKS